MLRAYREADLAERPLKRFDARVTNSISALFHLAQRCVNTWLQGAKVMQKIDNIYTWGLVVATIVFVVSCVG